MAWTRVDDNFLGHRKVAHASELLGKFGLGRVLVLWHQGQAHANRYLTDGALTREVVRRFHDDPQPLTVAAALVKAGLWEETPSGYVIHDYLEYNPSRDSVLEKRTRDLSRKHGRQNEGAIPQTFHAESTRNVDGIHSALSADSTSIPQTFHADSTALARAPARARPSAQSQVRHDHGTKTHTPSGCVARPGPLGARGRIDIAWPGRPPVPGRLHADFVEKLGGDPTTADAELRAWYPVVAEAFTDQAIGEDDFKFWRLRFAEWLGTAEAAKGNGRGHAALARALGPTHSADWYADCHHDPRCETGPMHRQRVQVDAAKQARAAPTGDDVDAVEHRPDTQEHVA